MLGAARCANLELLSEFGDAEASMFPQAIEFCHLRGLDQVIWAPPKNCRNQISQWIW